jgi:hypothetical protein
MSPRLFALVSLLCSADFSGLQAAPSAAEAPLVFNTTAPVNDLKGGLAAQVLFAQSQVIPAHPREGDRQPHLVALRKTLLLVRPVKVESASPFAVTVLGAQGRILGTLTMNPPEALPKTAYFVDGAPDAGLDFTPPTRSVGALKTVPEVEKLADPSGASLRAMLRRFALVEIATADGRWVKEIHLPAPEGLEGKFVRVVAEAGYPSTIHYGARQVGVSRGTSLLFKCANGRWFREGELENNALRYAKDAWSATLPAEWIQPGFSLRFTQGRATGELSGVAVGAPSQLLIHTIDLGFLTTPRGAFAFAKDPEAHREYFQTVPASRLIVTQYAPLYLPEVMLPTGTLLKEVDPSKGGWHEGTMRQHIGKELISHGIDNANYGLHSTAGVGEKSHPYAVAQLAAHNSRGNYSNGLQVHGGSGGNGMVTLDQSLGNEFSHEVGHNYGLGHYVDGFKGSVHRPADQLNSTWGWDADKSRFLPNFSPLRTGKESALEGQSQAPFDGRSFGFDAMAGGSAFSSFNRFTLYTPNTAAIIQKFLEGKAVFDPLSPTGFSKWDESASRMVPFSHRLESGRKAADAAKDLRKPLLFGVPVVTLVGYYDPAGQLPSYAYPALHGAFGYCYADDSVQLKAADCQLVVEIKSGVLRFRLEGRRLDPAAMNKFHVNVPEASQPRSVSIVCGGKVVDRKAITPVAEKLAYTVNGYVPAAR